MNAGNNALRTARPTLASNPLGYLEARSAPQSNGCVLWIAGQTVKGYGQAGDGDYAHRLAWKIYNGAIPDVCTDDGNVVGVFVRQSCGSKLCIARGHLFATRLRAPRSNVGCGGGS